ncbi:TIGR04219 family outer membrane beta-barrel protein [Vibrio sp. CAIM 722]|uniref:TIGR04219 family outer membrane beta-barrel protein n=1 Tax=Vibrio eleionomae TaxID=2653505 RepID=A0A7X4LPU6_9VIBR|nr:TIGR04219 family outer membrane beta-barrel protein [Vibrio eleionomae]MZI95924.1 TIGR04219 family outer membrane beta-barrel protein [Vibrio eleionomae]
MNKLSIGCCCVLISAFSEASFGADSFYRGQVGTDIWFGATKASGERGQPSNVPSLIISLEHSFPVLPNISFRYTNLVEDDAEFDKFTYTLYYHIFNQDLYTFDVGASFSRFMSGKYTAKDQQEYSFNDATVNLYTYGAVAIPFSPIDVFARIDFGDYGSSDVGNQDYALGIQWKVPINIGTLALNSGYRNSHIDIDELDIPDSVDDPKHIHISGWFVGAIINF